MLAALLASRSAGAVASGLLAGIALAIFLLALLALSLLAGLLSHIVPLLAARLLVLVGHDALLSTSPVWTHQQNARKSFFVPDIAQIRRGCGQKTYAETD